MKKILLFSILICFAFSSRYQYETTPNKNNKKYSYVGTKKVNKTLYTMWGIGIPGHNDGYYDYSYGYNLFGFYTPNTENLLHGFNMTLINQDAKMYVNDWNITITRQHVLMAYSMMFFPDLKTNQGEFYVRADIGLNQGTFTYTPGTVESNWDIGALVGLGYKLKTKKDSPYVMFELTSHFSDITGNLEGFLDHFINEPGELFTELEYHFLKGNWNLTVSVMADITKK